MVASMDTEFTRGIRVCSGLDVLDVSSIYTDWHVMLGLACYGAGVASDACLVVDNESVVHHWLCDEA